MFLLCVDEVEQYFYSDYERIADLDDKAADWWLRSDLDDKAVDWWLRSPGNFCSVAVVPQDGRIWSVGWEVDSKFVGVRPALWIKLDS